MRNAGKESVFLLPSSLFPLPSKFSSLFPLTSVYLWDAPMKVKKVVIKVKIDE